MQGKFIYLACEDGSLRVLKVKKNSIELWKVLPKTESRALSITLDNSNSKGMAKFAYVSYENSIIRKWDLVNSNSVL
jgi:hypothetical protein